MPHSFSDEFDRRVKELKDRAKAAGTNISFLCKKAGVAPTVTQRWRERVPKSIRIVSSIEQALAEVEAHREKQ